MALGNSINAATVGIVRLNSTGLFDSVTTTNRNVLIGAASNGITNVAPSATSGVPLISQGAASDPAFGTAVVAGGGTGVTSFTAYSVVTGGTTTTGALQNVSGVGSSGQVLTSNGAAALPTWQTATTGTGINKVIRQVFTASGTYTPSAGMVYCDVELCGGGGAGGGGDTGEYGGGGGAGGYAKKVFTAATIGASKTVTIGAGGTGVFNATGNAGGTTSLGAILSATGGSGGTKGSGGRVNGGSGGVGSSGDYNLTGQRGFPGNGSNALLTGAPGGSSFLGGTSYPIIAAGNGNAAINYGGGGGGSFGDLSAPYTGGAGSSGIVIITEYTG